MYEGGHDKSRRHLNYQWLMVNCQWLNINCQLSMAKYQWLVVDGYISITH